VAVANTVKYLLIAAAVVLALALIGRIALRALRHFIVHLWPH